MFPPAVCIGFWVVFFIIIFICFICFWCCLKSFSDIILLKQWNENEHDLSYKYSYLQTEILLTANIPLRRRESEKKIKWKLIHFYAWRKMESYLPVAAYIVLKTLFVIVSVIQIDFFLFSDISVFFCTGTSSHQVRSVTYLFLMAHMRRLCNGVIRLS